MLNLGVDWEGKEDKERLVVTLKAAIIEKKHFLIEVHIVIINIILVSGVCGLCGRQC